MIISIIVAMDDVQEEQMSRAQDDSQDVLVPREAGTLRAAAQERPGRYSDTSTN